MPIYEYRCEQGHTFEVMQRMSDGPLTSCSTCSAPVQRVFHPIAVHFKGSGFYSTDYGKKKSSSTEAGSESKSDAKSEDSKGSKESKGSKDSNESKPAKTKSSSSTSNGGG